MDSAVGVKKPEILAPAGDFVCLQAALDSGADAVYFGLGTFNMRARSGVNFKAEDLPENIYVSGQRYGDMMLRVSYSGRTIDGYGTLEYATTLLKGALADCPDGKCIYILPNYTAMLDLRGRLVKELKLKEFWKD